jgi:hypothetical protein
LGGGGSSTAIQKFNFANESISTLSSTLTTSRLNGANADNY